MKYLWFVLSDHILELFHIYFLLDDSLQSHELHRVLKHNVYDIGFPYAVVDANVLTNIDFKI